MVDLCELLITSNSLLYLKVEMTDGNFFFPFPLEYLSSSNLLWC
jgi:hypothetical protein